MRVAVYCRVSSEEQKKRESIKTQHAEAERYISIHGLDVVAFYEDDGVSGYFKKLADRPAGSRLLQDAVSGMFDTVLIYNLKRLGRVSRDILNAVHELEQLGVKVVSMTEPFDTGTPTGRFMLTILAGVAGLDRDTLVEASVAGTNRLAREGAWLGGIVPFGYRVEGKDKAARLVVSEVLIDGLDLSEADVVRFIYNTCANEHASCQIIADRLNAMNVPPAYVRDGRDLLKGKRKVATQGIWRAGRIRNMIVNTTYKGIHVYGRRATQKRELIERRVPPIVDEATWERAQEVLKENQIFSAKNARNRYLMRGLIKCGECGLTYVGIPYTLGKQGAYATRSYYRCNGAHGYRGPYGAKHQKCPSKSIKGESPDGIETIVWRDIEAFLRNPGEVIEKLAESTNHRTGEAQHLRDQAEKLQRGLAALEGERDVILRQFRKGRIDETQLGRQLDEIAREEEQVKRDTGLILERARHAQSSATQLQSAEEMLMNLNARLDEPMTWERKRQLVEALVASVKVYTVEGERPGTKQAQVVITYCFDNPDERDMSTVTRTGVHVGITETQ